MVAFVAGAGLAIKGETTDVAVRRGNVVMSAEAGVSRRAVLAAAFAAAFTSSAAPGVASAKVAGSLTGDYKTDASALMEKMKEVTDMKRGTPGMAESVGAARTTMNDFVAFYRRNGKVSGSLSFNTLYTAVNTLSGHYASYGPNYPVPEKRRKRLEQQYAEVERAISRGR